jgi:hypothetical protein
METEEERLLEVRLLTSTTARRMATAPSRFKAKLNLKPQSEN